MHTPTTIVMTTVTTEFKQECDTIAILTPKQGKLDRFKKVVELPTNLTASVLKNEPGVSSFHLFKDFDRESGKEELVLVERYADRSAYDLHSDLEDLKAMHATFERESLLEKPILIKRMERMSVLRNSAFAFCTDFASGTDAATVLNTQFTPHPEIQEYGPSWATSRLPYPGRSWIGRTRYEDTTCDAYFERLGDTLSFYPSIESEPPIDDFIVSCGNSTKAAVLLKIGSVVGSVNKDGEEMGGNFCLLIESI
ncbi:hypothetical protein DPV78_003375 [Talaromyces pinophilus]|nr:hypothetical protein DPV78_003375 [Talaromyces pinophilus]